MECLPTIPIDCSKFYQSLQDNAVSRRIPLSGSIEVTARCNLSCVHCYINLPINDAEAQKKELSSHEFSCVVDQIVDEGCLWLLFTGGEPFIREDFLDLYTFSKKKGLLITLFTNGTLITRRIAEHLSEWPPLNIEITLYGHSEQTYERITAAPGSFKQCMQGIELLLDLGLPVKLKTMVTTINQHEVNEMKTLAENLGVEFRFDTLLNARLDGNKNPGRFRISPREVLALDCEDENRAKDWKKYYACFMGLPQQTDYLYQCSAGLTLFHVNPYGELSSCIMSRTPSYDLRHGTFQEGWHEFILEARKQRWTHDSICKSCELISTCDQCPGWAQVEKGDQESMVEYLCEIAHLRANKFGRQTKTKKLKKRKE
jgi:radical SAM protein with 4Fe4S-binding SPASM domain